MAVPLRVICDSLYSSRFPATIEFRILLRAARSSYLYVIQGILQRRTQSNIQELDVEAAFVLTRKHGRFYVAELQKTPRI